VVKLSDFGCSKKLGGNNMEKSYKVRGTLLWMAPEAVNQSPQTGTPSDIWSMGATIIEMATGKAPWFEEGIVDEIPALLTIATTKKPPRFPSDRLSEAGLDFLKRCMEVDPEKRLSAKQLALHQFLVIEQTVTVSTAEVGRRPEIVGAKLNTAHKAAQRGRDLMQEKETIIMANIQRTLGTVVKKFTTLSEEQDWSMLFTKDVEITLPSLNVKVKGLPLVYSSTGSEVKKNASLSEFLKSLSRVDMKEEGEDETVINQFTATEVKNTRESIQVASRTAMWKWEIVGHSQFKAEKTSHAIGSALATFDASGHKVKEVEFVWDAHSFVMRLS